MTAWLGTVTHSLRRRFWHNVERLCRGVRKQSHNLRQPTSSTLCSSYFHFKPKLSLERCRVFTCSTQFAGIGAITPLRFPRPKCNLTASPSACFGRLFEYHSYNITPKSMEFYILIQVFCFDLKTAAFSGQESCLGYNLLLHFCPSTNYKCKSEFLKKRYPQSSKFILTCEMFLIIPLLLSDHSKKIGNQFPIRKIYLAKCLPFKIKISQC